MSENQENYQKAKKIIPGGVNSPARAFSAVESDPLFIEKGDGDLIYDVEGKEYIDYVGSWGPMILGYNHPLIKEKLQKRINKGTSFGAPTEIETQLAEAITKIIPSIEMIRMVNSGTEAVMSALRLARGYTGRDKIVKMKGCYHGHGDSLLVEAGSGVATLDIKGSPGVPDSIARETLVVPFNDMEAIKAVFSKFPLEIAGVIIEPIAGNMGVVKTEANYLHKLREITEDYGSLLIFDEVMTGFRAALGGAQEIYNIKPDITTLGKIIGGGLPVGAFGGKKEIMEYIAPLGPVYQAGTLSGNPLAMTAGLETIRYLEHNDVYQTLEEKAAKLIDGFQENINKLDISVSITRVGSMFCLFFNDKNVTNFQEAKTCDTEAFAAYFNEMLNRGIYLPPSQFESNFISLAHKEENIEKTIKANYQALLKVKKNNYLIR